MTEPINYKDVVRFQVERLIVASICVGGGCSADPGGGEGSSFLFSAYAPVDGITTARVDGAEYPLTPVGSGAALEFGRTFLNYESAQLSPVITVEFFQGSTVHHVGHLRPGVCASDCLGPPCPQGNDLRGEEVKYGLNAAFEPRDYECVTCTGEDGFVPSCK